MSKRLKESSEAFVRWPTRVKQNFLFQNKIFFFKTKLSFSKQIFLFENKTFFFKTKFYFWKQNFLLWTKKLFYETKIYFQNNFLFENKTFFLKAKLSFTKQNFLFKITLVSLVSSKQMRTDYWSAILRLLRNWRCHVLRVLWNILRRELRLLPRMWCDTWSRRSDHHEIFWKELSLPEMSYIIRTQFLKVSFCNFELTARLQHSFSSMCHLQWFFTRLRSWDLDAARFELFWHTKWWFLVSLIVLVR